MEAQFTAGGGIAVAGGQAVRVTPGTRLAATLGAAAQLAEIPAEGSDDRVTAITRTLVEMITDRLGEQLDKEAVSRTLVFVTASAGFTWNGEQATPLASIANAV